MSTRSIGFLVLAFGMVLGGAARATASGIVTCPNPIFTYGNKNQHVSNTYTVNPAVDCVWGPLDSSNIGQAGDDFLTGEGINDDEYGDLGPTFGINWSLIGSTGNTSSSGLASIDGLTFTNFTGILANWSLDAAALNLAYSTNYNTFALGVKDGSDPQWAVFLLDSANLSGTVSMTGGSFSHFALYGARTRTPPGDVPEPASLVLLGMGLVGVARAAHRRGRATSV